MRATFLLAVAIGLIPTFAVACLGSDERPAVEPPTPSEPVSSPVPSPSPAATPESLSGEPVDALLIEWKEKGGELTPLDSALRNAAAPMSPVQVGPATVSPDGSRVALWDANGFAVFHVDPDERTGSIEGIGQTLFLAWEPGSGRFFTLQSGDLLQDRVAAAGSRRQVGVRFGIQSLVPLGGGDSLLALGYEAAQRGAIDVSRVFLALVDSESGEVRSQLDLPGVTLGQRKEKAGAKEYYAGYWPALALSPDGRRAYVAHSNSEAVTVIDLDRMAVEKTVALREPRSRWERFVAAAGHLFASRAEAKGGLTFRREAVTSPEGRWLYVTGSVAKPCGFSACEDDEPAGLWAIDTRTMRVVHREAGINHITLSPDGKYVAGTGVSFRDEKGWIGRGVKLLRTGTWELVSHFEPESVIRSPVFSRDGARLLTIAEGPGLESARYHDGRCLQACHVLRAIDVASGRVVATRELFGHSAELVSLAPAGR